LRIDEYARSGPPRRRPGWTTWAPNASPSLLKSQEGGHGMGGLDLSLCDEVGHVRQWNPVDRIRLVCINGRSNVLSAIGPVDVMLGIREASRHFERYQVAKF
jgi:hypothetical protein